MEHTRFNKSAGKSPREVAATGCIKIKDKKVLNELLQNLSLSTEGGSLPSPRTLPNSFVDDSLKVSKSRKLYVEDPKITQSINKIVSDLIDQLVGGGKKVGEYAKSPTIKEQLKSFSDFEQMEGMLVCVCREVHDQLSKLSEEQLIMLINHFPITDQDMEFSFSHGKLKQNVFKFIFYVLKRGALLRAGIEIKKAGDVGKISAVAKKVNDLSKRLPSLMYVKTAVTPIAEVKTLVKQGINEIESEKKVEDSIYGMTNFLRRGSNKVRFRILLRLAALNDEYCGKINPEDLLSDVKEMIERWRNDPDSCRALEIEWRLSLFNSESAPQSESLEEELQKTLRHLDSLNKGKIREKFDLIFGGEEELESYLSQFLKDYLSKEQVASARSAIDLFIK